MSPVSRSRKAEKRTRKKSRDTALSVVQGGLPDDMPPECHCPACVTGTGDPTGMLDALLADVSGVAKAYDPLEAEAMAATILAMGAAAAPVEALTDGLIPMLEARGTSEALALLSALGAVADGFVGDVARAASSRLVERGVGEPAWAGELAEPVAVGECLRFADPAETASILVCPFHRSGRSHAWVVTVDHLDCAAANEILLVDGPDLPEMLRMIRANSGPGGVPAVEEILDPAEARWHIEAALAARAEHDNDAAEVGADRPAEDPALFDLPDMDDEDGPADYPAMALLLAARTRSMPPLPRPLPAHGTASTGQDMRDPLDLLADVFGRAGRIPGATAQRRSRKLPAKRRKADGPAPIYQVKISLRGAKPPIWRRLEVPGGVTLAKLDQIIQAAFGWCGGHLHVFETPYGEFGTPDRELDFRSDASVTLEQVAPGLKSKIRYTYDFGDDWVHDIVVEETLDRQVAVRYPRCTGGRRAAPPDDCGGIWGYASLVETLADPSHPDHTDMVDWLGLGTAADFDPAHFDPSHIDQALAQLR